MKIDNGQIPGTGSPTHAGAVVYRMAPEGLNFLVISSSDGRHWVLPKGHVDDGESPQEAALRELVEEAGVVGRIVGFLSEQRFPTPRGNVVAHYFLVEETGEAPAVEERRVMWVDQHIALDLLSFENTRDAVRQAARALSPG
jgi:8-oxo-dGTP pyrophosphatase MutT (NUDIX family)